MDKVCKYCKHLCWDDENTYHICYLQSCELETKDRKQVHLSDVCSFNNMFKKRSLWG